jgi:hypothetical protein
MVVLAAVLVLVALVVFLMPLARTGPAASARRAPGAGPATRPGSPSGSLARGFGYLYLSPGPRVRRGGVHERLARAFARVDAVDPHEAPRRIGEALAQTALGEPPRRAAAEPPSDLGWRSRAAERPRDVG